MPHDCKQGDFPFGTLKSLRIFNRPDLWLSTNLEMIYFYYYLRRTLPFLRLGLVDKAVEKFMVRSPTGRIIFFLFDPA